MEELITVGTKDDRRRDLSGESCKSFILDNRRQRVNMTPVERKEYIELLVRQEEILGAIESHVIYFPQPGLAPLPGNYNIV